jgi:hypothetical protein
MEAAKPKTFFIPGSALVGQSLKKGSKLNLEVVFVDPENSDVEVKMSDRKVTAEEELRPMLAEAFQPQGTDNYGDRTT